MTDYAGPNRRAGASDFDERIISKAEMRETFKEAAHEVIHATFSNLGIDLRNQSDVNSVRETLVWAGDIRAAAADAAKIARRAVFSAIALALLGWVVLGFKSELKHFLGL